MSTHRDRARKMIESMETSSRSGSGGRGARELAHTPKKASTPPPGGEGLAEVLSPVRPLGLSTSPAGPRAPGAANTLSGSEAYSDFEQEMLGHRQQRSSPAADGATSPSGRVLNISRSPTRGRGNLILDGEHSPAAPAEPVAPRPDAARYLCVKRGVVRAGIDLLSKFAGYVNPGDVVMELSLHTNSRAQTRVLCGDARGRELGWVSTVAGDGSVILTVYHDGLDDEPVQVKLEKPDPVPIKIEPPPSPQPAPPPAQPEEEEDDEDEDEDEDEDGRPHVKPLKLKIVRPDAVGAFSTLGTLARLARSQSQSQHAEPPSGPGLQRPVPGTRW